MLKFLLSGLVTPVIKQILLFAIFTASLLPGKAFGSGQDDQLQAMRRNSDLRRIENDRVLEELSRKTQWDKSRAVVYAAKKRFTDKGLPGRVSFFSTSATLRGTVSDDDGNPISDVEVSADFEGEGGTWTKTGTDGSYEMTVEAGKVKLRLNENDLIPTYLRPKEKEVTVEDDTATTVDFTAYASDATISGMVLLDGTLLSKVGVSAEGKTGWTRTETASDGTFTLQVASEADATGGYNLWVNTHDLSETAFRKERYEGIKSGTADLKIELVAATSFIEGTVTDNAGTPIVGVSVYANQHQTGNHVNEITGSDGSFKLGVIAGRWWLDVDAGQMMPDYLVPQGEEVNVTDGTTTHSFTVYATDATITGMVYFDGEPMDHVFIGASSELGWAEAVSDSTGAFSASVSSVADDEGGYHLWVHEWSIPSGSIIEESYHNVTSGTSGLDFNLSSPNAFIEGKVIDDTGASFFDLRVWAERDGEQRGFSETRTDTTGYYKLGVAPGRWRINVDGWELRGTHLNPDWIKVSVSVASTVTKDIILLTADASISGAVFLDGSPVVGIGVEARSRQGWSQATTNSDGTYSIAVASKVDAHGGYHVYAHEWELHDDDLFHLEEHWNVTSGTAGVNFHYVYANSFVEGKALDENGDPIAEVKIYANSDLPPWNWIETKTDATGAFKVGLIVGNWWIRLEAWDLMPDYLAPRDTLVTVASGETVSLNLSAVSTDATITGTVTLDGLPLPDVEVRGDTHIGWTQTRTDESGLYTLSVASEADDHRGYNVWLETWRLPDSSYVEKNWYQDVLSGSSDRNFNVYKTKSGFKGRIFSEKTEKPVHHVWIWAWDGVNQWGQNAGVEPNGKFRMWVPNGTYDVYANGDGYEEQLVARSVSLDDEIVEYTIYLEGEGPPLATDDNVALPRVFALHPNHPNPFNPETIISYDLPEQSHVTLNIYDLLGRHITVLSDVVMVAGSHTVRWSGTDTFGLRVSSGVYILRFDAEEFTQTRKMLLLR